MKIPSNLTRYTDKITYVDRMKSEAEEGAKRTRQIAKRLELQPQLDKLGDEALKAVTDSVRLKEIGIEIDSLLLQIKEA